MATAPGRRRTYWIATNPTPLMQKRAKALAERGFDVNFLPSIEALQKALEEKRATALLVGGDDHEAFTAEVMAALMTMPEIQGTRQILCLNREAEHLKFLAACTSFRDLIPMDIDEGQWLARVNFATATKPIQYIQPTGQIALKNISKLALPARITWVNHQRIRFECRARPALGTTLHIGGALAQELGGSSITAKVVATQRSHLLYRFSDAFIAEWSVGGIAREQIGRMLSRIKAQGTGPRLRIFVAIQSADLRTAILSLFDDPRFEISAALSKQSILDEPRFFTPDIVVIEDALCREGELDRLDSLLASLVSEAAVAVLGKISGLQELQKRYVQHRLLTLPRDPDQIPRDTLAQLSSHQRQAQQSHENSETCHLAADNPLSLAEVYLPARLTRIHPLVVQVATPVAVGPFALARLDSPLVAKILGRHPWLKVTDVYHDAHPQAGSFSQVIDAYLADTGRDDRLKLANSLTRLLAEAMGRFDGGGGGLVDDRLAGSEQRTPELGVIRSMRSASASAEASPFVASSAVAASSVMAAIVQPTGAAAATASSAQAGSSPATALEISPQIIEKIAKAQPLEAKEPGLFDSANELGRDVVRDLRKLTTLPQRMPQDFKYILKFVAIVFFGVGIFWAIATWVAPNWHRSGGAYTDSLRRLAPHLEQKNPPSPSSN